MNTEQTNISIFTYIKMHYGEAILVKIQKLEKTMIKYSSYLSEKIMKLTDGKSI